MMSNPKTTAIPALVIFLVFTYSSAQTVISIGSAFGARSDSCYRVGIALSNPTAVAGLQCDLADAWSAVRIDSLRAGDRASGFVALQHDNRVLLFHPMGESLQPGEGEVVLLYLKLSSRLAEIDSLFFATPPIVASADGERILPVAVRNGSIHLDALTMVVDMPAERPHRYALYVNYPNPFNESTTIAFELAHSGRTRIVLYDVGGRSVATVWDGIKTAGRHQVVVNARDLASGIYFYRLSADAFNAVGKMILLR